MPALKLLMSPGWDVKVMSWSRNCPNCITMCETEGLGLFSCTWWTATLTDRALGRTEGSRPPRGIEAPSRKVTWYSIGYGGKLAVWVSIVHESWHSCCSGSPFGRGKVVAGSVQGPVFGVRVALLVAQCLAFESHSWPFPTKQLTIKGALQQGQVGFFVQQI